MPFGQEESCSAEQVGVATGHVFVGLANISGLEIAADIRLNRGAEAGVFDPALVKLLAKSYSLGEPDDPSGGSSVSDVARACRKNLEVASAAGLKCRSAVWSTVLTLLPQRILQVGNQNQSQNLSHSMKSVGTVNSTYSVATSTAGVTNTMLSSSSSSSTIDSEHVPFASELLGALLSELLEGGDCQHFTVLCELLKKAGVLEAATLSGGISKVTSSSYLFSFYFSSLRLMPPLKLHPMILLAL
jgi:hypothetical protein